jgi:hypothetical protein
MFDALPAPQPPRLCRVKLLQKGLYQGSFADTGLPRDKEQLACAGQGTGPPGVELCQLGLAPNDQRSGREGEGGRGSRRGQRHLQGVRRLTQGDRGHKAITNAMHRGNVLRVLGGPPPAPGAAAGYRR